MTFVVLTVILGQNAAFNPEVKHIQKKSAKNGKDEITLDEINAEIKASRAERKAKV